jgi:hypothetical protein
MSLDDELVDPHSHLLERVDPCRVSVVPIQIQSPCASHRRFSDLNGGRVGLGHHRNRRAFLATRVAFCTRARETQRGEVEGGHHSVGELDLDVFGAIDFDRFDVVRCHNVAGYRGLGVAVLGVAVLGVAVDELAEGET